MLSGPALLPLVGLLGLVFGSFITALSYRLPRGQSTASGRSRCPACGTTLGAVDLVPVFSWIFFRGRCRHCGAPVHWRYPVIEAVTAGLFVTAAVVAASWPGLMVMLATVPVLVAIAVIGLEHGRVPDVLALFLLAAMAAWRWIAHPAAPAVAPSLSSVMVLALGFAVIKLRPAVTTRAEVLLLAAAAMGLTGWQFVVLLGALASVALIRGRTTRFLAPIFAVGVWVGLCAQEIGPSLAS